MSFFFVFYHRANLNHFVSHVDQVDQMAACTEPATVTIVTTDHALHANDQAKHPEPTYLIIDSGATSHMTGNLTCSTMWCRATTPSTWPTAT